MNPSPVTFWNILIIDDDDEDILILQDILREERALAFQMTQVNRADQLRKIASQSHDFDIILTDYQFQFLTGYDLIWFIKHLQPRIPFIFVTDWPEAEILAKDLGADGVMRKSELSGRLLIEEIQAALDRWQTRPR